MSYSAPTGERGVQTVWSAAHPFAPVIATPRRFCARARRWRSVGRPRPASRAAAAARRTACWPAPSLRSPSTPPPVRISARYTSSAIPFGRHASACTTRRVLYPRQNNPVIGCASSVSHCLRDPGHPALHAAPLLGAGDMDFLVVALFWPRCAFFPCCGPRSDLGWAHERSCLRGAGVGPRDEHDRFYRVWLKRCSSPTHRAHGFFFFLGSGVRCHLPRI